MKNISLGLVPTLAAGLLFGACSSTHHSKTSSMSKPQVEAAWAKYATPGEKHKLLEPMVGSFRTASKSRMSADEPWQESTGTCENRWVMDGRFVETNARGTVMGMPYEGHGVMGYDNSTGKFSSIWYDSMGTGVMSAKNGKVDSNGKVFTFHDELKDPITGDDMKVREVFTIKSAKEHTLQTFTSRDGEPEYNCMSITFTRI